jgi:hypothetical protein
MNNKLLAKIFCGAISAVMMISLVSGCEKSENNEKGNPTDIPSGTVDGNDESKGFSVNDLDLVVGGKTLKIGGKESTLKEVLGEPLGIDAAESCIFDGDERFYTYETCAVFTFPPESGAKDNTIDEVYFFEKNDALEIKGGINIGSTVEEVKAALGNAYFMDGDQMMVYNAENDPAKKDTLPKLYFELTDGVVSGIGYCANLYHAEG